VDNEAFILDDIPGPSSTHYKPSRGYDEFVSEKLAIILVTCKASDQNAVHILVNTAEIFIINVKTYYELVINTPRL